MVQQGMHLSVEEMKETQHDHYPRQAKKSDKKQQKSNPLPNALCPSRPAYLHVDCCGGREKCNSKDQNTTSLLFSSQ